MGSVGFTPVVSGGIFSSKKNMCSYSRTVLSGHLWVGCPAFRRNRVSPNQYITGVVWFPVLQHNSCPSVLGLPI